MCSGARAPPRIENMSGKQFSEAAGVITEGGIATGEGSAGNIPSKKKPLSDRDVCSSDGSCGVAADDRVP